MLKFSKLALFGFKPDFIKQSQKQISLLDNAVHVCESGFT